MKPGTYHERLREAAAAAVIRRWPRHSLLAIPAPKHPALAPHYLGGLMPFGHIARGGGWFPNPGEAAPCCAKGTLHPSFAYPFKLRRHADTIRHVAQVWGVNEKTLRSKVARIESDLRAEREAGQQQVKNAILAQKQAARAQDIFVSELWPADRPAPAKKPHPLLPLTDAIPSIGPCDSAISRLPSSAAMPAAA